MSINFNKVYGFELTIYSVDSGLLYDFTQCISAFTIKRPRAETSQPMGWSGSCSIEEPLMQSYKPASLDNFKNADPYKIGNTVKIYFYNILLSTCYLTEYFYDEESGKGDLSFEGSIGYWNYSVTQKDYKSLGFEACKSTNLIDITNNFTRHANSLGMKLNVYPNLSAEIDIPPNFQGNCISQLQPYYGERMHWLYESPDGSITSAPYPLNVREANLILRLAVSQVTSYKSQKTTLADMPKKKLIGTASVEKRQKCDKGDGKPLVEEDWGYIDAPDNFPGTNSPTKKVWVLQSRTTTYPVEEFKSKTTQRIKIEQAKGVVSPEKNKGEGTIVKTQDTLKTDLFDSQNRLIQQTTATDKLLCLALPEQFPGDFTMFNNAEKVVEVWEERAPGSAYSGLPDGIMRHHGKTTTSLFASGTSADKLVGLGSPVIAFPGINYLLAIKEKITETWESDNSSPVVDPAKGSDTCSCNQFTYKKQVRQRENYSVDATERGYTEEIPYWDITGLNLKMPQGDSNDNDTPPAFQTRKAECPTCTASFSETLSFDSPATSSNFLREETVSTSTLQNRSELTSYLRFIGNLQLQRYRSRQIALPLPVEYVLRPTPFRVVGVGKRVYIIDSESISLGEDGIEFMFIGNDAGALAQEIIEPDYTQIKYYSPSLSTDAASEAEVFQGFGVEPALALLPDFEFVLDQEV